jgi:hypothetical protein
MLRLCCTNSSWLQGLWKKADSHVSFQMRECSWRHRSSGVLRAGVLPKHQQLLHSLLPRNLMTPLRQWAALTPLTLGWFERPAAAAAARSRPPSLPAQEVTALDYASVKQRSPVAQGQDAQQDA